MLCVALAALGAFDLVRILAGEWAVLEHYRFGYLVPFLTAYLLFLRWEDRPVPGAAGLAPGMLVLGLTLFLWPLRVVLETNPDWRLALWLHAGATLGLITGSAAAYGGWRWARFFLPALVLMLFAVPVPTRIETPLVQGLMRFVASVASQLFNLAGIYAEQEGNVIRLSSGLVGVEEACSGIRSLQSCLMTAWFVGELFRLTWLRRGLLLLMGFFLAIVLNLGRTLGLTWAFHGGGSERLNAWHDPMGYGVLGISFVVLLLGGNLLKRRTVRENSVASQCSGNSRGSSTAVLLAIGFGLAIGSYAFASAWIAVRGKDGGAPVPLVLNDLGAAWEPEELQPQVLTMLRYSEGRRLERTGVNTETTVFFFEWNEGSTASINLYHGPEVCMRGAGWENLVELEAVSWSVPSMNGEQLAFSAYQFVRPGQSAWVYYGIWDDRTLEDTREGLQGDSRLLSAWEGRRLQSRRSLQYVIEGGVPESEAREAFLDFLDAHLTRADAQ